jgi:TolB-like protein
MMRLMAVALAVSMATGTGNAAGEQASTSATMVMPFANPDNTPKLYWLGEGSAVLLGEFLERYGARTMTRDERVRAFERLQLPPAAALSHATMIKAGQFVGATDVVIGSYELANDRLTLRVRVIQLEAARMGAEVVERGALTDLFEMFDRAARRMVGAVSPAPAPAAGTLLASPAAFELYIKGLIAESSATQRSFLEQAGKAAPADDRIRLALWQVHSERGDYAQALAVANRVPANSLHSRTARYLAARSQLELKRYDDAFNTLKALQGEGRSAAVLNALGIVQLRRGATTRATPIISSTSVTATGSTRIHRLRCTGCAKRSAAIRQTARLIWSSPRRFSRAGLPPRPRGSASWRSGSPRRQGPPPTRCPAGSSG